MRSRFNILVAMLVCLFLAVFIERSLTGLELGENDAHRFQKRLNRQFDRLDARVDELKKTGSIDPDKLKDSDISLLVFYNDSLVSYSSNTIFIPGFFDSLFFKEGLHFNSNAWFVARHYYYFPVTIVGLIKIKNRFPSNNRFLTDVFSPVFRLPDGVILTEEQGPAWFPINDPDGEYLFSLDFSNTEKIEALTRILPVALFFVAFLFFLQFLRITVSKVAGTTGGNMLLFAISLLLIVLRLVQTLFKIPGVIYNTGLFSPYQFANSVILPSMGDLLLNTLILLFLAITAYKYLLNKPRAGIRGNGLVVGLVLFLNGVVFYNHHIFTSLIINSSFSLEFHKLSGLSAYSFLALAIILFNFSLLLFAVDKLAAWLKEFRPIEHFLHFFSLALTLFILAAAFGGIQPDPYPLLFYYLTVVLLTAIRFYYGQIFRYSFMLIFVLLFAVYSVYFIIHANQLKERQNMVILAETLANEHDPVAEMLLERISPTMAADDSLAALLTDQHVPYLEIQKYLKDNYFSGFWSRYNFQFFDCYPWDSVHFGTRQEFGYPCHQFFNELISERGTLLPNSTFYYVDHPNGRVNYLGLITYRKPDGYPVSLFIELESRLIPENVGYPELLLDDHIRPDSYLKDYSYGKYHNNGLISQTGTFRYNLFLDMPAGQRTTVLRFDGYDHLVYQVDEQNAVILSRPSVKVFDMLILFSYLFVYYYLIMVLILFASGTWQLRKRLVLNFRNKIQVSVIAILLFSLVLIGGGTIYYSIGQYEKKNRDTISEKIQSVYVELDHKLAAEDELSPYWSSPTYANLNQLLVKFADVFYTDINLYANNGDLIASSRPEIFETGLTGNKINPEALQNILKEGRALFVHRENIGTLKYMSAYMPFFNASGEMLAILNLPYFTREDILRSEITTLIIAIVNIYVILMLLTVAVAIILADAITKPLSVLQEKFGKVKLLRDPELIDYSGTDEVAALVTEYNRMVKELKKSAEMLSRSERESAWREMARQIAHEIKNPLTPMRLAIQHLQRTWDVRSENYNEIQQKVTQTLIGQIDNLSRIASEFSTFAQMPRAEKKKINLTEVIKKTADLFSGDPHCRIKLNTKEGEELWVNADKEQLSRVFINLINNGIQAVPGDKEGLISISLNQIGAGVIISITDNGKGIPDELKPRLFTPNFTTKSGGTGLGLAISKNIIEHHQGSIRFETEYDKGTTFFIILPLFSESPQDNT